MMTTSRLLGIVLAISSVLMSECRFFPKSSFDLAKESRPPKWMAVPPGLARANVSIKMHYYVQPWGREAQFILKDEHGKTLKAIAGKMKCLGPLALKHQPAGFPEHYPSYEAITVAGVTEMIEHRKMEPLFYVTDDAAVRKELLAAGCSWNF